MLRTIRELPIKANEVMLDIGNLDWVTVYVVGHNAFILPPDKRSAQVLLDSGAKQKEVSDFLKAEFDVTTTSFPCLG